MTGERIQVNIEIGSGREGNQMPNVTEPTTPAAAVELAGPRVPQRVNAPQQVGVRRFDMAAIMLEQLEAEQAWMESRS